MGEINECLGSDGNGRDLCGFTFFRPTFQEMGKFEKWLEDGARSQAIAWKDLVSGDDFAKQLAATSMLINRGQYSWSDNPNSECAAALDNPPGKIRLLHIIASRSRAIKIEDIKTAYFAHRQGFDDLVNWMLNIVPNSPPPANPGDLTTAPGNGTTPTKEAATA